MIEVLRTISVVIKEEVFNFDPDWMDKVSRACRSQKPCYQIVSAIINQLSILTGSYHIRDLLRSNIDFTPFFMCELGEGQGQGQGRRELWRTGGGRGRRQGRGGPPEGQTTIEQQTSSFKDRERERERAAAESVSYNDRESEYWPYCYVQDLTLETFWIVRPFHPWVTLGSTNGQ